MEKENTKKKNRIRFVFLDQRKEELHGKEEEKEKISFKDFAKSAHLSGFNEKLIFILRQRKVGFSSFSCRLTLTMPTQIYQANINILIPDDTFASD